ncbi:MAG: GIY-YIG nuclease family protein [Desulfotomaculaceae bacterium]|nr:GIY-YIG nuclease family protein [Desulfotomaculaceae bacterium]
MDRRKELKELYKNMKPDMGIFIIKSTLNNKCYIEGTQDLKGTINGTKFRLNFGNYSNRELQKEWKEHGEESFTIEILENLEYDKDESKIDYTEDLTILKMIWEEKLAKQGVEFYKNVRRVL